MDLFQTPHPLSSRRLRRSRYRKHRLQWYSKSWMILSCYMLSMSSATSPLSHLSPLPPLCQTWSRLLHLDCLVDLSPSTLWQYNDMSFHSYYSSSASPSGINDQLKKESNGKASDISPSIGGEDKLELSIEE